MIRSLTLAVPLAFALVACGDETAEPAGQGDDRGARGEVLGGTISDDMIPLDQLQSQSPPLRGADDTGSADGGDDAGATAEASEAESAEDGAAAAQSPREAGDAEAEGAEAE
ncbi:hypothetical protein P8Q88_13625 [Qipengyuania sp. XHP0207]|uniref:hypothetical protein n=1 Tax=Qipengyuania sp. XHP0207 TaxID=3038078 RepID=UPI00241E0F1B|nr:hypothetical protein [Qipengyuania sp. XHP0207]MDG5749216.1 hypothetical protein [Qipengyuania sp. XHP0207]